MRYTPEADRLLESQLHKARREFAEIEREIPRLRDERDRLGRLINQLEQILYPIERTEVPHP